MLSRDVSRDVEAYDAMCDATSVEPVETPYDHELDTRECGVCGTDCRCDGPHESIATAIVAAAERVGMLPRRIKADPRLAAIADQLAESILATLAAHGYAIVREADTSFVDEQRNRGFAREAARNAAGILGMEGAL